MKRKKIFGLSSLLLIAMSFTQCTKSQEEVAVTKSGSGDVAVVKTDANATKIFPGQVWNDIYGKAIVATGGGIYYENGFYHWYGEAKKAGSSPGKGGIDAGMHCYRSRDLINWNDFGVVLPLSSDPNSDIADGCIFQRPKVVKNNSTGKYVAFFKLYLKGEGYTRTFLGIATATSPTGPFTYVKKVLATSNKGSGDFTMFKDTNGDLYHIAVRRSDRKLVKAKMSSDYMTPGTYSEMTGVQTNTEGPAIFYKSGVYHLLGSGSNGWDSTAPRYFTSSSLGGPWTSQSNPCTGTNPINGVGSDLTWGGQSTFIFPIEGHENQYVAMFDIWVPERRYIWLPFRVDNQKMHIAWQNSWDLTWYP
ncbi:family 43 glycosylhydrolase [Pedobacter sp. SD-b]|uniref:Family 43 glycosylhydrolase n=1 Tax=Pedobacter segetis TaxID=2793069 RepID=A0ABS1BGD7_9SPHI|nr:family 43 glycosylhydrolase [Pedobacter segetis]MBK0381929.1 family 43 glycosylhydrolase [Pedobacter segetis]